MFWGKIKEMSRIVRELTPGSITVPDGRVRRITYDDGLRALADSIRDHGVIEPLIVRRIQSEDGSEFTYNLVAGERRLRAAKLAGLATVPCVTVDAGEEEAAAIAIIENLHREDLNIFEEASAIASLIALAGLTQEMCARRLSVSQSYVANKLRLLRFSGAVRERILAQGLTERHARALLRLPEAFLDTAISADERGGLNVASTEKLVEEILAGKTEKKKRPKGRMRGAMKDIRLFYNSVDRAVAEHRRFLPGNFDRECRSVYDAGFRRACR
jgi:ParB family chromosome partitioning protein